MKKRHGKRVKREWTDEQRQAAGERMAKARAARKPKQISGVDPISGVAESAGLPSFTQPEAAPETPLMQTPVEAYEEMKGGDAKLTPETVTSSPAPTSEPDSAGTDVPADFVQGMADLEAGRVVDMEKALSEPPPPEPFQTPSWARQDPLHDPERATVTELPNNPRIAICGDKHVDVGNSENLTIGFVIPVIPHPSQSGWWLMTGPLPRMRGRW